MMKPFTTMFALVVLLTAGCKTETSQGTNDQYEKGTLTVADIERKEPARFLIVSGNDKKNLLGQTVIKGVIINKAKVVSYKDIDIKLSFYSKTGALLEEDHEVIYETIAPGASASFKTKYFAAKGTDSVAMKIITAQGL